MSAEKGNLQIHTENILPIIKKWLYSDKEIFIRELVSNAVDAMSKLKQLSLMGEYSGELADLEVQISVDEKKKTITFADRGLGMTADEVKQYINQIAFSSAEEFIEKYKDAEESKQIIGHFGLGFYSAFMVADKVEIVSKSYKDEPACKWINEGGIEFSIEEADKKEVGTDIVLYVSKDEEEFLNVARVRGVVEKYCNFLPFEIKLNGSVINDQSPLWLKSPRETKDEEYKEFYKKLYPFEQEPLFWIHLDVEVPFRLKGILYFPKLQHELDSSKGRIKLFCNQVFVSDDAKEVIPQFLTLLQGTLDAPDIPLNVSRSYLQHEPYVKKISDHITKKIADKLNSLFKKHREDYEKYWDDIHIFIKYGMMNDDKFYDKMKDALLFKTTDGAYKTLDEYKEKNKGINKEKDGKQVVLYAKNEKEHISLINMVKDQGMEAVVFDSVIDVHFLQLLETKDQTVSFARIDSDANEMFHEEESESKIVDGDNKTTDDRIKDIVESILKKDNDQIKIEVKALKNDSTPAMIVFSEYMRRFKEMNFMRMGEKDENMLSDFTLRVNSKNPIIGQILKLNENSENSEKVDSLVHQIYDLALLGQNLLNGDRLVNFIDRTGSILSDFYK